MKTCPACQRSYDNEKSFCVYDGNLLIAIQEIDPFTNRVIDNKYSVNAKIAEGGAGTVYQATHLQLQSVVAIKIMRPSLANDPVAIERFRREAYAAMKVRHPNAVAVLDFGITADRLVYVIMEFLVGQSLADRLKVRHSLSITETNHLLQQVCAAVAIAHARGIVHRDLKPENIFLHQEDGQEIVKVLDFGIAKMRDYNLTDPRSSELTGGGAVIGTPYYIAPEQCSGQQVDARADIYSMGIVLYQMLTGHLPFDGPSSIIVLLKQLNEKPPPLSEFRPDIPPLINAVVMHALEKDVRARPQSIAAFAQEFAAASRAVSEREFQDVFLNATEKEIDAALLLTTDTINLESNDLRNFSDSITGNLSSRLSKRSTPLETPPLGSPAKPARTIMGHLSWFDLTTVCYMLTELRETGLLTLHNTEFPVESSQDLEKIIPLAWMYINEGHIQYVHLGVRQGREAFYQLFQMPLEGSFLFQQHKQPPVPQNYTALTETSSILIKEALGLRTLLSRFALKFPDLLMTFQPRAGKLTWRDADTEELATFIWELLRQPQVSLSEILARSPCCNAKTYQVLANLLATRQINVARTTNLNAEITNSIRTADF